MLSAGHVDRRRSTRSHPRHTLDLPDDHIHRSRSMPRTLSNATSRHSVLGLSSPIKREEQRRRKFVRKSLLMPQIRELTIERRAKMLTDLAGDCLVKVIRAGLNDDDQSWLDCERSWDGFISMRSHYILGENSPPIVLYEDILEELSNYPSQDLVGLNRAMEMCNLATLAHIILQPDEASKLAINPPVSRKGKGRASRLSEEAERIAARNQVLCDVWERYWMILPDDQKDKEMPLRLWLQFATQICLHFQQSSIDPPSPLNANLPSPSGPVEDKLFDPLAVSRFGRWGLEVDQDAQSLDFQGMDQEIVESRWRRAVEHRLEEMQESNLEITREKYPYDNFRLSFLEYLESIIASGFLIKNPPDSDLDSASDNVFEESEGRSADRRRSTRPRSFRGSSAIHPVSHIGQSDESDHQSTPRRVTRSGRQAPRSIFRPTLKDEGDTTARSIQSGQEESDISEDDKEDDTVEPFQWDLFQDVAMQMQAEYEQKSAPTGQQGTEDQVRAIANDTGLAIQADDQSDVSVSNKRRKMNEDMPEEEPDWAVREGSTPRALVSQTSVQGQPVFNFASRQQDAEQVDWDSQTPVRNQNTNPGRPLFVPGHNDDGRESSEAPSIPINDRPRAPSSVPSIFLGEPGDNNIQEEQNVRGRSISVSSLPSVSLPPSPPPVHVSPIMDERSPSQPAEHPPTAAVEGSSSERRQSPTILVAATAPLPTSSAPEAKGSADEEAERVEDNDLDMEDLMPDTLQLTGDLQSSVGPVTPDPELGDIMPSPSQILGSLQTSENSQKSTASQPIRVPDEQIFIAGEDDQEMTYDLAMDMDGPEAIVDDVAPPRLPTSQRQFAVARARHSRDALEFAGSDAAEDEDDRLLLTSHAEPELQQRSSEIRSIKESPPPTPPPRDLFRLIDPYLVDEFGETLRPNPDYVIPRDYKPRHSKLHGQIENRVSSYSRFSGPKKWSAAEALLLYRTVQQIPLDEVFPLRVVWYLHGEFGALSRTLRDHNPQHMKDKMRTIVETRWNNKRSVVGRARAYLKPTNDLRKQYEQELAEMKQRAEEEAEAQREPTPEAEEGQQEENASGEEEENNGAGKRKKAAPKRRKSRKGKQTKTRKARRDVSAEDAQQAEDEDGAAEAEADVDHSDADLDELDSDAEKERPKTRSRAKGSKARKPAKGAPEKTLKKPTKASKGKQRQAPKTSSRPTRSKKGDSAIEPPDETGEADGRSEGVNDEVDPPASGRETRSHSKGGSLLGVVIEKPAKAGRPKRLPPASKPKPNLTTKAARKTAHVRLEDLKVEDESDDDSNQEPAPQSPPRNEPADDQELVDDELLADFESEEEDHSIPIHEMTNDDVDSDTRESEPGTLEEEEVKRKIHEAGLMRSAQLEQGESTRAVLSPAMMKYIQAKVRR